MIKSLILVSLLALVGCANQLEKSVTPYQPANMTNFVPNCRVAKAQIWQLTQYIDEYNEYHRTHPTTLEGRRYYGRLKNAIWSLRSSCSALQR